MIGISASRHNVSNVTTNSATEVTVQDEIPVLEDVVLRAGSTVPDLSKAHVRTTDPEKLTSHPQRPKSLAIPL